MLATLIGARRFAPLFWCQFFSAFNDNLLKNGLVALIVFGAASGSGAGALVQLAGALLILPFFVLSGLGGELADAHDKAVVTRWLKGLELLAAAGAAAGFLLQSVPLLLAMLGLFGVVAALFGPIKYGILPDQLAAAELPGGNALIEGATFLAILAATVIGTKLQASNPGGGWIAALMMALALACWGTSLAIPRTGARAPGLRVDPNVLRSTVSLIAGLIREPRLMRATLAASWFWLYGAMTLAWLATLVSRRIGGTEDLFIACMLLFSISIAIGSAAAAWLAHGQIRLRPALAGSVMMAGFAIDFGLNAAGLVPGLQPVSPAAFFSGLPGLHFGLDLFGMAAGGGLMIVPVFAALQLWAGEDRRARTIAANNVVNAGFIVAGALLSGALQQAGVGEAQLFLGLGASTLVAAVLLWRFVLPLESATPLAGIAATASRP